MADSRRAWAKALFLVLGRDASPEAAAEARERAAVALEAAAAVIGGQASGAQGASLPGAGRDAGAAAAFFFDPAIPKEARVEALSALYGGVGPDEARLSYGRFVGLLVEKGRVALVPAIARSYRGLLDREAGIERASLTSARPLPPETVENIREAWKKASGASKVEFTVVQDPALLGGFVLRTDSVRYDWSVAGRIRRLGQELSRPLEKGRD